MGLGRGTWHEPSNVIAGIAAVLSLLSLVVSVRSCVASDRAAQLAHLEFRSQRTLILDGAVSADNDTIALRPQDPSMTLQQARVLLPSPIARTEWNILPPDRNLPVVGLRYDLAKLVERTVSREKGYAKVVLEANLPVAIISLYTTKGQAFEDRSIYRVIFSFVVDGDSLEPPKIDYKGIVFVERISDGVDIRKALDTTWELAMKNTPVEREAP